MPQITVTINTDTHKVVPIELYNAWKAMVHHACDWNNGTHAKIYRPIINKHMLSAASEYKGEQLPEIEGLEDE